MKSAISKIHQLCTMGLNSEALVRDLLLLLHDVVPSYSNSFMWFDRSMNVVDVYDENTESPYYEVLLLRRFRKRHYSVFCPNTADWVRKGGRAATIDQIAHPGFYEGYVYRRFLEPLGYDQSLNVLMQDENRGAGMLMLHRRNSERGFSAGEIVAIHRIEKILEKGMCARHPTQGPYMNDNHKGLMILDEHGEVWSMSPEAHRLCRMALSCDWGVVVAAADNHLNFDFRPLLNGDHGSRRWPSGVEDNRLIHKVQNSWGYFEFHKMHMEERQGGGARKYAFLVERKEPLRLVLMRRLFKTALSYQQREVCLYLLQRLEYDEIAEQMGISRHTVIDHVRNIYAKLNLENRLELMERIIHDTL